MPKQLRPVLTDDEAFRMINQYKADYELKNKSDVIKDAIKKARKYNALKTAPKGAPLKNK